MPRPTAPCSYAASSLLPSPNRVRVLPAVAAPIFHTDVKWYNVSGMPMAVAGSGGHGRLCPSGLYCTGYGNPVYGFVSFDNMLWAWLTIFQCITQVRTSCGCRLPTPR